MITVRVYTNGGNVLNGQIDEHQVTELIKRWSSGQSNQMTLALAEQQGDSKRFCFVRYDAIVAIEYSVVL